MIEIICSGIGGQGVLVAGMVLADIAMEDGKNVSWYPSYGFEMRGGAANCEVKIGEGDLQSPYCLEPDILLTMSESAIDTFEERLKPGGVLLVNSSLVPEDRKYRDDIKVFRIPATDIANELDNHKGTNIIMLGALAGASDIYDVDHVRAGMEHYFAKKGKNNPSNVECFNRGALCAEKQKALPLEGVKVVEMGTVVAAPTTARMLCAYGAEVIKVEGIDGDVMRVAGSHEFTPYEEDLNPLFTIHNSNKKFISLNYKTDEGKKILLDLIGGADVFITNVREKSLKKNGLDYETLKESNPSLIYALFSGYGPEGPASEDPGFDISCFWMRSGPIGDWGEKGAFPLLPTYAFGDMATSSAFLSGILMALYGREKTGMGTKVDISLFANGIWCNSIGVVQTQFDRKEINPEPLRPSDPFNTVYKCKDGRWIGVYCNEYVQDKEKISKLYGIEDIVDDPRYEDIDTMHRLGTIDGIIERCNEIFLTKDAAEWRQLFHENNVACEIMRHSREVSSDPQAIGSGYVVPVEFPDDKHTTVMMPSPPLSFSEYGRKEYEPTGGIGEHTDRILKEMGYSDDEIAAMKEKGAVR